MRSNDSQAMRLSCAATLLLGLYACGDDDDAVDDPKETEGCKADDRSKPGFVCEKGELVECADASDHPLRQVCTHCGCEDGYRCDEDSERCIGDRGLGDECANDGECASSNCGADTARVCRVALGAQCTADDCDRCFVSDDGASFCSKPCRNSSMCSAGFVCDREQCVPGCCGPADAGEGCAQDATCRDGFVRNDGSSLSACRCDIDPAHYRPIDEQPPYDAAVDRDYIFIHAGSTHSCAIRNDLSLVCWGDDVPPSPLLTQPIIWYDAGNFTTMCGVLENGAPFCDVRQLLGVGDEFGIRDEPSGRFLQVHTPDSFACGLRTDHTIVCWGGGNPELVQSSPAGTFRALTVGDSNACAVTMDGQLKCWGSSNHAAAFGDPPSGEFVDIGGASDTYCAVHVGGAVSCWGLIAERAVAPAGVSFRTIQLADDVGVCGLTDEDEIVCFGFEPEPDPPPAGKFSALSLSLSHACALDMEGDAQCWSFFGGDGPHLDVPPP